jgi:hypothetical protein
MGADPPPDETRRVGARTNATHVNYTYMNDTASR